MATDYGLWVGSYTRGELPSMRAHAAAFLSDVEVRPGSPETSVDHRAAGMTSWFAGEYRDARDHLERALALFQPGRDDELAFRFGNDAGVSTMAYLAIASWPLGEVDRSVSLIDRMQTRIAALTHVGTLALGRMHAALFEMMRGDHPRAASNAFELARLAREHDLPLWRASAGLGDPCKRRDWQQARGHAPLDTAEGPRNSRSTCAAWLRIGSLCWSQCRSFEARRIEEMTIQNFDSLFAVNVWAPYFLIRQLLRASAG